MAREGMTLKAESVWLGFAKPARDLLIFTSAMTRQPARNADLHGNVPDNSPVALLLVDVINDMTFEGAGPLRAQAVVMARNLAMLKQRARAAGIPAIYINDNFGRWRSDFRTMIRHCLEDGVPGEDIVRTLHPEDDDYFVLKPKHSAFFETTLDTLLSYLGATTLILTGIAGNICILFSANDAYMRDYRLIVPSDCVVSNTPEANEHALAQMAEVLKADISPSHALDLDELLQTSLSNTPARGSNPNDG
jgi:nicotinamidase-related amidase